jgi:peptide/nickel transport system permease protein
MKKDIRKKNSQTKEIWRRFKKNKVAVLGLVIIILLITCAIFADFITPFQNGITQNAQNRLQPPSKEHIFGTDGFGRDVFSRTIHASRVSLAIGFGTTFAALLFGSFFGAVSGYYGGRIDNLIMRICDIFMCIPGILLTLALVSALGTSTLNLFIAISIASVPGSTRFIRSLVLNIVGQEYIEAARSNGASDLRIIYKYILPNIMGPIIVTTTMSIGGMILMAAGLSFIGMGVQPPNPEWGAMLSSAKEFIRRSPYLLYYPGGAILLSALSFNLVGDGLRDALDPKMKN